MELFDAIYRRRDVREFLADDVPDDVVMRLLDAAHHAGSVGFSQPWNFIIVRSEESRERIADNYDRANRDAAQKYSGTKRSLYQTVTHNPIRSAPLGIAVTCDRTRGGDAVLGKNTMRDTDLFSTCCAIQNLWLAARAEEIGMCWVSILDPDEVKETLRIPHSIELIAYLCLGYAREFAERPDLERAGWASREPLEAVVFEDVWQSQAGIPVSPQSMEKS